MILADTSIWIAHLRSANSALRELLDGEQVLSHPLVTGELAVGNLKDRQAMIRYLNRMPKAHVATDTEVLWLIEQHRLYGLGLGYIDVHLLASIRLARGHRLWTRDQRLAAASKTLGVAAYMEQ